MAREVRDFLGYVAGLAVRPRTTTRRLVEDPRRLRIGVLACLVMGMLYTVSVFVGYLHGFGAVMSPSLPIPARDYYLWETFFTIPVFFLILATAAATTQLVSRGLGGKGTFEDTFAVLSLGILLPTFLLMWVPETLVMVFLPHLRSSQLGGFSFMPDWLNNARQVTVPLWALVSWITALPLVQRFSILRSALVVVAGLVPAAVIAMVFIR